MAIVAAPAVLAMSAGAETALTASVTVIAAVLVTVVVFVLLNRNRSARLELLAAARRLEERERQLREVTESVPVGIFRSDAYGNVRWINGRLAEIAGRPLADMAGRPFDLDPADLPRVTREWRAAVHTKSPFRSRFRTKRAGGEEQWVEVESWPSVDEAGEITGWTGSVTDVTNEVDSDAHLRRLSEIVEATPDLIAIVDASGRLTYANHAARQRFAMATDEDLHGLTASSVYAPYDQARVMREALPTAREKGAWLGEVDLKLPDGTTVPVSQVLLAHNHPDGSLEYYSSITRDLSERRMFEAQLAQAAWYDPITALPNRAHFVDALTAAMDRAARIGRRVAVLRVDLDHFKLVNDSFGHEVGNSLLQTIGDRLRETAGPHGLVARFTSDEFCVLIDNVEGSATAMRLADGIAEALAAPITLGTETVFVTVSTGVAISTSGGRGSGGPEALLRDADVALHRAKDNGRDRTELFVEDFRHHAVNRLRTATDLHRALTEGEFRVVYQPEIDLRTGHILGVEALVRWHHPERGLVPPTEFIPLAEETGLIAGIGNWVLDTAIEQASSWSQARWDGAGLLVWVNLSARQLGDPALVDLVAGLLEEHRVPAEQLGLEITETALLEDAEGAVDALTALRALGVRLAVDDFGTGYSSLAYLKRLPVDAVKVDRSFVSGLGDDKDDAAIVAAVSGMARALRLRTIAEGVEDVSQLQALRRLGCDVGQGYLFSTGQPPLHVSRLLDSDRAAPVFAYDDDRRDISLERDRAASGLPRPRPTGKVSPIARSG